MACRKEHEDKHPFKLSCAIKSFHISFIEKIYPQHKWVYIDRETKAIVNSLRKSSGGMESWWYHLGDNIRQHFIGKNYKCKNK